MIYVYSIYHFFAGTAIDCSVYKLSYFFILRKNASMSTIPISLLQISCLQESTVTLTFDGVLTELQYNRAAVILFLWMLCIYQTVLPSLVLLDCT